MDCGRCGAEMECPREDNTWVMDDEIECEECGSLNMISFDENYDEAYVSMYVCPHGINSDDPCEDCEAEDSLHGE